MNRNYHGTDNRNRNDKDGESDWDIWLYMSFYVITAGPTIGIHSDRRASRSRRSGQVGEWEVKNFPQVPRRRYGLTYFFLLKIKYSCHIKWVGNNDENNDCDNNGTNDHSTTWTQMVALLKQAYSKWEWKNAREILSTSLNQMHRVVQREKNASVEFGSCFYTIVSI